jgi:hypothetical protein
MVTTSVILVFYSRFLTKTFRLHIELFTSIHIEGFRQLKPLSNIFRGWGKERPIYNRIGEVLVPKLGRDVG